MSLKITTEIGREMLESVTPIYNNDDLALSIFEANGKIMDNLSAFIMDLKREIYPQNSTWSIEHWEYMLGIDNKEDKRDPNARVQRVLLELNKYAPVTRSRMKSIVDSYTERRSAQVYEYDRQYRFRIVVPEGTPLKRAVFDAVEETKPAHLRSSFYVLVNGVLHQLDPEKMTIAPVIKYRMRIGDGFTKNIPIEMLLRAEMGIGTPFVSGQRRCGNKQIDPYLGKSLLVNNKVKLSTTTGVRVFESIRTKMPFEGISKVVIPRVGVHSEAGVSVLKTMRFPGLIFHSDWAVKVSATNLIGTFDSIKTKMTQPGEIQGAYLFLNQESSIGVSDINNVKTKQLYPADSDTTDFSIEAKRTNGISRLKRCGSARANRKE
ncbi:hypothetical protein CSV72_02245 [Sporosarcina sp. P20a]|uniref:putative phage tail protein n=1 Tax=Sporosarcina sp. P20a TaxID=2048256 RepID=UPI000C16540E|nr:putative phage tail protein [Sporosarcina sp. P20a]PIC87990.1 hypothetical protein CSV72_02245 [Sporosarcina sp. P20a]